jgi:hypothetical protein
MRRYLLPAVVCAAFGALVLLLANRGESAGDRRQSTTADVPALQPTPQRHLDKPADTRTRLDEHKDLRELQRSLAGNLVRALDYRQRVCEDLPAIRASERLSKDLLDTIREYIDSDDAARRHVVIPILRVFEHPEATRMIAERYARTTDEAEQMTLLEAMAKPFHDPKQAAVWGLDKALTSPSAESRERAFDILRSYITDNDLLVSTSMLVYSGAPDERQRQLALRVIDDRKDVCPAAREFLRRVLRRPNSSEDVLTIAASLASWGDDDDASLLEQLANEYPMIAETLREQARIVRRLRADRKAPPTRDEMDRRAREDQEREDARRVEPVAETAEESADG